MSIKNWIIILGCAGFLITAYLVVNEIQQDGYCPCYPIIGIPACYMVILFFILILIGSYWNNNQEGKWLVHIGSILGIITAIWFSYHQLIEKIQCPKFIGFPLCYLALITFITIFYLRFRQDKKT